MRLAGLFALAVMLTGAFAVSPAAPQEKVWLSYDPAVVELEGKLTIATYSEKPSNAKSPKVDRQEEVPILELSRPINVRGGPTDDPDEESVEGLRKVQLVIDPHISYRHLIGMSVTVKGSLFHAQMKHRLTDVLLVVKEIRKKKNDKGQ